MKKTVLFIICFIMIYMETNAMQPTLSEKEERIVEISSFTSAGNQEQLAVSLNKALNNKMTINEINEILIQSYAYCGFPKSLNAITTFINVIKERKSKGIKDIQGEMPKELTSKDDRDKIGEKTREKLSGRKTVAEWQTFAPGIEQYLKEHLFADIFARGILNHQERELATVSFLAVSAGVEPQLKAHINMAKNTGLSDEKLNYAVRYAQFITSYNMGVFNRGAENTVYAKYFTGKSYLEPLAKSWYGVSASNVVFEPSCRNNWHIHHKGGQILLVTGGNGWYQEWNKPARKLKAGDVVEIPAGIKHWHGASKDSFFAHIAIAVPPKMVSKFDAAPVKNTTEWLEPVSDSEYSKLK